MSFTLSYIFWHYSKAFKNILGIFSNFLWAAYRFFSISLLLKNFFSPWHRLDVEYVKNGSLEDVIGTFIVNTLMRIVGMFMRGVVITTGILCLITIMLIEIIFFFVWIILPAVIVWLFYAGITTILK